VRQELPDKMAGMNVGMSKHAIEAKSSWKGYLQRRKEYTSFRDDITEEEEASDSGSDSEHERHLKNKHEHKMETREETIKRERLIEKDKELQYQKRFKKEIKMEKKQRKKAKRKRAKKEKQWRQFSNFDDSTWHGMMIDAGSTGSRLHVYELKPRILVNEHDVIEAVAGRKLTYPAANSRWTERLRPGLGSFSSIQDEKKLEEAIAEYLTPLLKFAEDILHSKTNDFAEYPIFLKATAGLRVLSADDRTRVIGAVRTLFANKTFCPFWFEEERVRTISGEEEAVYGWTGVNYLMGILANNTKGVGSVTNARLTYGALDMGGGSTQISFYEPNGDIMSNLFKLQIGQGKHWNVYAHSFLHYGHVEALERVGVRLVHGMDVTKRLVDGVYNPCLPGKTKKEFRSNVFIGENNIETLTPNNGMIIGNDTHGFYSATLKNNNERGDYDECAKLARSLFNKTQENAWCNFSHQGSCSFAGVYQPTLPIQGHDFGEFLAFSNFYHVWDFLKLPSRASLNDLKNASRYACNLSRKELVIFNNGTIDDADLNDFCFHSAYSLELLHSGYGFDMDNYINAYDSLNGLHLGWALGAMLYEINTLPWKYVNGHHDTFLGSEDSQRAMLFFVLAIMAAIVCFVVSLCRMNNRHGYDPI